MKIKNYIATIVGLCILLPAAATHAGPPGTDGSPQPLFAHVFSDGSIEQETAVGITQQNVRRVDVHQEERGESLIVYCLSGLPRRIFGGQVTLDAGDIVDAGDIDPSIKLLMPVIQFNSSEVPDCKQRIIVWNGFDQGFSEGNQAASFYLLLY
jgi:hypothetical protein